VGEGQGGGCCPSRRRADRFDDTFQIHQDLFIREAKHLISLRSEPFVSRGIAPLARSEIMRLSIDLDHELCGVTDEVSDVLLHRHLPTKTKSIDALGFDVAPEQSFRARHALT
jgi:hypothetical protein